MKKEIKREYDYGTFQCQSISGGKYLLELLSAFASDLLVRVWSLQLVMYPILNLRHHKLDLHWYLRSLEEVVIRVLQSTFSMKASRLDDLTGVWVGVFFILMWSQKHCNKPFKYYSTRFIQKQNIKKKKKYSTCWLQGKI